MTARGAWRSQSTRLHSVTVELCWRPAVGDSSGDFHDVVDLRDGRVALVLGDAPAFGPVAAELGEELRFELRRALLRPGPPVSAVDALTRLDALLTRRGEDSIATAVCAILDPAGGRAEVTNAGHLPILLTTDSGSGLLEDRVDPPLGVALQRQPVEYPLKGGTSLVMFTDGLVERRDGSLHDGLATLVRAAGSLGARDQASHLAEMVTAELGEPTDDATVMAVTFHEDHETPPVVLRVYVDRDDPRSNSAERVVQRLAEELRRRAGIEVTVDVADITRSTASAERDGIMAAPTVIRVRPEPAMRVVGGLRSAGELARALQLPHAEEIPD